MPYYIMVCKRRRARKENIVTRNRIFRKNLYFEMSCITEKEGKKEIMTRTFDEPITGSTPTGANTKITDSERFWISVIQEFV